MTIRGGRQTYKKILDEYGPIMKQRVFRLGHVDKSKFKKAAMEEVFTVPDRMKVIRSSFPTETKYSKSKLNAAIQQAFIDKVEISLDENTRNRSRSVCLFLRERLAEVGVQE